MKLGEKIRVSRRTSGLSQEQLAEKMSVSRSAVAKWETVTIQRELEYDEDIVYLPRQECMDLRNLLEPQRFFGS